MVISLHNDMRTVSHISTFTSGKDDNPESYSLIGGMTEIASINISKYTLLLASGVPLDGKFGVGNRSAAAPVRMLNVSTAPYIEEIHGSIGNVPIIPFHARWASIGDNNRMYLAKRDPERSETTVIHVACGYFRRVGLAQIGRDTKWLERDTNRDNYPGSGGGESYTFALEDDQTLKVETMNTAHRVSYSHYTKPFTLVFLNTTSVSTYVFGNVDKWDEDLYSRMLPIAWIRAIDPTVDVLNFNTYHRHLNGERRALLFGGKMALITTSGSLEKLDTHPGGHYVTEDTSRLFRGDIGVGDREKDYSVYYAHPNGIALGIMDITDSKEAPEAHMIALFGGGMQHTLSIPIDGYFGLNTNDARFITIAELIGRDDATKQARYKIFYGNITSNKFYHGTGKQLAFSAVSRTEYDGLHTAHINKSDAPGESSPGVPVADSGRMFAFLFNDHFSHGQAFDISDSQYVVADDKSRKVETHPELP